MTLHYLRRAINLNISIHTQHIPPLQQLVHNYTLSYAKRTLCHNLGYGDI